MSSVAARHHSVSDSEIADAIRLALSKEGERASVIFSAPTNSRAYGCKANDCQRPAYASGLCNAHYIRVRAGKSLDAPVRARKRNDACSECGEKTGAKGGWGLCARHYKNRRKQVVKDAVIDVLGGKCFACGGRFHRAVFDFHHVGRKDESPASILSNKSPEDIGKEISRCLLLCANCHRLEHHNDNF
jgi:hypothetical protein